MTTLELLQTIRNLNIDPTLETLLIELEQKIQHIKEMEQFKQKIDKFMEQN